MPTVAGMTNQTERKRKKQTISKTSTYTWNTHRHKASDNDDVGAAASFDSASASVEHTVCTYWMCVLHIYTHIHTHTAVYVSCDEKRREKIFWWEENTHPPSCFYHWLSTWNAFHDINKLEYKIGGCWHQLWSRSVCMRSNETELRSSVRVHTYTYKRALYTNKQNYIVCTYVHT